VTDAGLRKEKKILDEAYLRSGGVEQEINLVWPNGQFSNVSQ
jgi:hypothetical protein